MCPYAAMEKKDNAFEFITICNNGSNLDEITKGNARRIRSHAMKRFRRQQRRHETELFNSMPPCETNSLDHRTVPSRQIGTLGPQCLTDSLSLLNYNHEHSHRHNSAASRCSEVNDINTMELPPYLDGAITCDTDEGIILMEETSLTYKKMTQKQVIYSNVPKPKDYSASKHIVRRAPAILSHLSPTHSPTYTPTPGNAPVYALSFLNHCEQNYLYSPKFCLSPRKQHIH
jgi:hypothetical protein